MCVPSLTGTRSQVSHPTSLSLHGSTHVCTSLSCVSVFPSFPPLSSVCVCSPALLTLGSPLFVLSLFPPPSLSPLSSLFTNVAQPRKEGANGLVISHLRTQYIQDHMLQPRTHFVLEDLSPVRMHRNWRDTSERQGSLGDRLRKESGIKSSLLCSPCDTTHWHKVTRKSLNLSGRLWKQSWAQGQALEPWLFCFLVETRRGY